MYTTFHKELINKRIEISFNNGKLQYKGPETNIDDNLISSLKKYKQDLIKDYWPKDCFHIMPLSTEGNKTPLILLHMGDFADVLKQMKNERPVYGMYYLGSEGENYQYKTVEELVDLYMKQLLKIVPKGPYYLGGLSFGGIIAYEMATRLIKMDHEVPLLIIADAGLYRKSEKNKYDTLSKEIYYTGRKTLSLIYRNSLFYYKTLKRKLYPASFYKLDIQKRSPYFIYRNIAICRKYKPTTLYAGETLLFISKQNTKATKYMNWDNVCKNISVVPFNGSHRAMYEDKNISNLIKTNIQNRIKKIETTEDVINEAIIELAK